MSGPTFRSAADARPSDEDFRREAARLVGLDQRGLTEEALARLLARNAESHAAGASLAGLDAQLLSDWFPLSS
jgi:hypothetical protein